MYKKPIYIHSRIANTKALTSLMFTKIINKTELKKKPLLEKRISRMCQNFQIEA